MSESKLLTNQPLQWVANCDHLVMHRNYPWKAVLLEKNIQLHIHLFIYLFITYHNPNKQDKETTYPKKTMNIL